MRQANTSNSWERTWGGGEADLEVLPNKNSQPPAVALLLEAESRNREKDESQHSRKWTVALKKMSSTWLAYENATMSSCRFGERQRKFFKKRQEKNSNTLAAWTASLPGLNCLKKLFWTSWSVAHWQQRKKIEKYNALSRGRRRNARPSVPQKEILRERVPDAKNQVSAASECLAVEPVQQK